MATHSEFGVSESSASESAKTPLPSVTVVVPVHNEAGYVESALPRLLSELEAVDAETSVLVVENGSTDATADLVEAVVADHAVVQLLQLPEPNYGAAIRAGFASASSDWVVVFDIDYFSGPFLAAAMAEQHRADVIVGSKRAPGSEDRRAPTRRIATWTLNFVLRAVLGLNASDTHGMKAIRRSVVEAVVENVVSTKDLFDTELVLRAERSGFRIIELPVVVEEERESKTKIWQRIPRTLVGIWRIRAAL